MSRRARRNVVVSAADPGPPSGTTLRTVDWRRLFDPRRAVFIGASDREGTQQRNQWVFMRDRLEARGCECIPVHPTKPEILGTPAVRSVLDVDGVVDFAVVLVRDALPAVEECVAKGVGFVVVFSAGFAELGTPEGLAKEQRLKELASGSTRVLGPNTNLNLLEPWRQDLPGRKMAIITQSGFQGRPMSQGQTYGIPVQSWATLGNETDLEWADLAGYYAGLPDTGVITSYVEGFKDGRTLMIAADVAARQDVPIVVIKVGRSAAGQQMAQAHTGHLTGSDAVHDAAFEQCGIVRVDDFDEAIEISGMFCHVPPVEGTDGVALYTLSGGTAAHLVDLCGAAGLPVPRFSDRTIAALTDHIPAYLRMDNPVDTGGTLTALPAGRASLEITLDDENTNIVIVPITGVFPGMIEPLARDLVDLHLLQKKPILVVWSSPLRDNDGYRTLIENGVPVFHSLMSAVRGAGELLRRRTFLASYKSPFAAVTTKRQPADAGARALLTSGRALDEVEAKAILREYGIATVPEHVVGSPEEAVRAVEQLGGRAALKILSADIAHKSDLGLVRIGVGVHDAADAYRNLAASAARVAPHADVRGVVVQQLVADPIAEAIIGISHQAPFGPVVLYGLGGVFAEVFEDVSFGVPPFGPERASAMIAATKGSRLLHGARGRSRGDVAAIERTIMAAQRIAVDLGDVIGELDINPLMVLPDGCGAVAVDALIVPRRSSSPH
ncbi:acetate--CoA ligase family protein [Humibacter sp.]|uniref:acetate--CoA ligase family protein n=1 Tax=Humibacter sp. TaxID=1940291 RepID=UPI002BE98C69|nr:acetate--CoA ligase family protein [Humibacter sp.]HVX09174.1 acetate--CoA ligase family protein [Humibacter sp.]